MFEKVLAAVLAVAMVAASGCYNTYNVSLDELGKVAEGSGTASTAAVSLATEEGEQVVVSENTKIGVTEADGTYHPVSPFNFTLTRGQLVAPDEDLLLSRSDISTGNVKLVSGGKTAALVITGVVALAGLGVAVALSADEKKGFGEK